MFTYYFQILLISKHDFLSCRQCPKFSYFFRYGYKVWCLSTITEELLVCQPYAGVKTSIPDQGLGQGPNVVMGLCQQFGLSTGTKVSAGHC